MLILKLKYHIIAILKQFGYRLLYGKRISWGTGTTFRSGFHLMIGRQGQVRIGDHCFFNHDCSINCLDQVEIGPGTIFGEGVRIYDHNHRFSDATTPIKEQGYVTSPVQIGSHCWIGSNVVILRRARIGDHCVIGAGCVVNGIVADNTIVSFTQNETISNCRKDYGELDAKIIRNHGDV